MKNPKVFISYSWSTPEHEEWVLELAEQLMQSGIETILDKWDLQIGHNAYHFMEKMVNDETIDKVLIVCDETYVLKANSMNSSGVSTETQIISPAVYANNNQEKFVALVTQRDEKGKAYLPTYYSTRMYIDFSNSQSSESFEKLVRFIFGKPLHKRPDLGAPPAYITNESSPSLGTTAAFNRAYAALRNGKSQAEGAVEEYFSTFITNLEKFKVCLVNENADDKANKVYESVNSLLEYRNEAVILFSAISQYSPSSTMIKRIHSFFDRLVVFLFPSGEGRYTDWDFDNFKFLSRELYLCMIAAFIKQERFQEINHILTSNYFIKNSSITYKGVLCDHSVFSWHLPSLGHKNKSQKLGKTSLPATMLKERAGAAGVSFEDMMQADFLLYLRAKINLADGLDDVLVHWWPDTAVYVSHHADTFEIFVRAASSRYYERIKPILNDWPEDRLLDMVNDLIADGRLPKFGWDTLQIRTLMGADKLCTRP
ncbi:toll/interleukin-1 receptor domain-containing protein [Pseudomonas amygdali]